MCVCVRFCHVWCMYADVYERCTIVQFCATLRDTCLFFKKNFVKTRNNFLKSVFLIVVKLYTWFGLLRAIQNELEKALKTEFSARNRIQSAVLHTEI